jgi:DNA-binding MarR family transcriptional regulator
MKHQLLFRYTCHVTKTQWLSDDERAAWRSLQRMQMQLLAVLSQELADSGLSYQDYLVLAILSDQADGRLRLVELAVELGWEKSRLSHHVARMTERGLVTKERCPTDQRGFFVAITKSGQNRIKAAAPSHVDSVRRHFIDLLTTAQLKTIETASELILDHLNNGN